MLAASKRGRSSDNLLGAVIEAEARGDTPGQQLQQALQDVDSQSPLDQPSQTANFEELRKLQRKKNPRHAPFAKKSPEEVVAEARAEAGIKQEPVEPVATLPPSQKRGPGRPKSKSPGPPPASSSGGGASVFAPLDERRNKLLELLRGYLRAFPEAEFHFQHVNVGAFSEEDLEKSIGVCRQIITKDYHEGTIFTLLMQVIDKGVQAAQYVVASNWDAICNSGMEAAARPIMQLGGFPGYVAHVQQESENRRPGSGPLTPELKELAVLYGHYLPNHPLARLAFKLANMAGAFLLMQRMNDSHGQKSKEAQEATAGNPEAVKRAAQF